MKSKIVLWGENDKAEKQLLALELMEKENEVKIHSFPQDVATEEFYNAMMEKWREGQEVDFPENHKTETRTLTATGSILPDDLKVDKEDIITRAQAEWHFIVLSSKLYDIYETELADIEDKVKSLVKFEKPIWNEMIGYWDKVQEQVKEKNLFRDHAGALKQRTNVVFDSLKKMRKELDQEFEKGSKEVKSKFFEALDDIEGKIEKKLSLGPIFGELKKLQSDLKGEKLTRNDRNSIWNRIDKAFKQAKENRGENPNENNGSQLERVEKRYQGLLGAIDKMQKSINRDQSDLDFQDKRINNADGQLEAQLRQARVEVIKERIRSKGEKLDDMLKTKVMLEGKIEKEKAKEAKRAQQQKVEEAKEAVKEKIAAESTQHISDEEAKKLEEAAAKIKASKRPVTPVELPKEEE